MYSLLLYSFLISSVLFGVLQYMDKNNKENSNETYEVQKHMLTTNNMIVFFMMFITCFALLYFAFSEDMDLFTTLGLFENDHKSINIKDPIYDVKTKTTIDPGILKRINDPLKYGFEPYSGGSDMSSNEDSSISSGESESSSDSE